MTSSEKGDVIEVALVVGGHDTLLITREVHETMSGSLHFHRFDETVESSRIGRRSTVSTGCLPAHSCRSRARAFSAEILTDEGCAVRAICADGVG